MAQLTVSKNVDTLPPVIDNSTYIFDNNTGTARNLKQGPDPGKDTKNLIFRNKILD